MIAGIRGKLEAIGNDRAIIDVHGISFRVYMPTSALSALGAIGKEVRLHTHFHLREDGAVLYGFASADELMLFETLTGVSGLGAKLGLAMLSTMNVEQIVSAIATGNAEILTQVPGIGKKVASRIILELKDKIGATWTATTATQIAQENTDVLGALISLGYSVSEASRAVTTIPTSSNLSLEERIKLALQYFGGK